MRSRRLAALAAVVPAVVGLTVIPATVASANTSGASPTYNVVTVSANFSVVDDDSNIFGHFYNYAGGSASKSYVVSDSHPMVVDVNGLKSQCAGNDVVGSVTPSVERVDGGNLVGITMLTSVTENGCFSDNFKGNNLTNKFYLAPGATYTLPVMVSHGSWLNSSSASITISVAKAS